MKIGYARVSSFGQNLETQREKLASFGCEKIFDEKKSGAKAEDRPQLKSAIEYCREGDILVVTKLDRLARSMFDLQKIVQELERKQVEFVVLDEQIDTTTPTGRFTFHLLGAVAEFERALINERRNEGMEKARQRGVKFGRRAKLSSDKERELMDAHRKGAGSRELAKEFGVSKATINRIIRKHKDPS